MNIIKLNENYKILQKSGFSSAMSTRSKYVFISSSVAGTGNLNEYKMTITVSTSSGAVYNGYGMRVYAHIPGKTKIDTFTISGGTCYPSTFTTTFSISADTSVYASCICAYCEDGLHSEYYNEFSNSSSSHSLTYINPVITPNKPNPKITFTNDATYSINGNTLKSPYTGKDTGVSNSVEVSCGRPGNATKIKVGIDRWDSPNWAYVTDNSTTGDTAKCNRTFSGVDIGKEFRVTSIATSSTNHTASGDTVNFRICSIPTMDGSKITTDVTKTTDSVKLSWAHMAHSYINDADREYRIHLQKLNTSNNNYEDHKVFIVKNTTETTFKLSDYGFNKGDKTRIYVEPGHPLCWSQKKYGGIVVTRNSIPYFTAGTIISSDADSVAANKYFLNNIKLSWNAATDNEKDTLTYKIYYRTKVTQDSWNKWGYIITASDRNYIINASNLVSKGEAIQFGIIANDGLEDSDTSNQGVSIISNVLYRAIEPPAPTQIVIEPSQNKDHYESLTKLSWTKAIACNGKDCVKYKVYQYVCNSKDISGVTPTISEVSTTYIGTNISNITRGKYIIWRIYSVDQFDLVSTKTLDTKWCQRNRVPSAPKDFKITGSKPNFYLNVPLQWSASTDPDGDDVTYSISVSYNGGVYTTIATNIKSTTYTHDISNRNPGDTLSYKVWAVDSFGATSSEVTISNNNIVVNTKPSAPEFILPTSFVYDKRPRILLITKGDVNKDDLTIVIKIGSTEYNSSVNSSAFNKSTFSHSNDKIVFVPPVDLAVGRNTIKAKLNDGMQDSNEITFTIEYIEPTLNVIPNNGEVFITKDIHDKLGIMISNSRRAYGLSSYNPSTVTVRDTTIQYVKFNEMYSNIVETTNWINSNYPGLNRNKTKPTIAKSNLISKDIYNAMLNIITNL